MTAEADHEILLDRLLRVDAEIGLAIAEHRLAQGYIREAGSLLRHRRISPAGALQLLWENGVDQLVLPADPGVVGDTGRRSA